MIRVHRLVVAAFRGRQDKLPVNHINEIKDDNQLDNLEYVTHSQNNQYGYITGSKRRTTGIGRPIIQYNRDMVEIKRFDTIRLAEDETGVNHTHIGDVCRGKRRTAGGFIWQYAQVIVTAKSNGNTTVEDIDESDIIDLDETTNDINDDLDD